VLGVTLGCQRLLTARVGDHDGLERRASQHVRSASPSKQSTHGRITRIITTTNALVLNTTFTDLVDEHVNKPTGLATHVLHASVRNGACVESV